MNPDIDLDPWLHVLVSERDQEIPFHCLQLLQVARLKHYLLDPITYRTEIYLSWQRTGLDTERMRSYLMICPELLPVETRVRIGTTYAAALSYAIVLQSIIVRCLDNSKPMIEAGNYMMKDIIHLAEESLPYRPLGSSAVIDMLMAAWPYDISMRPQIEDLLVEYLTDLPMARWQESVQWLDEALGYRLAPEPEPKAQFQLPPQPETGACCIL